MNNDQEIDYAYHADRLRLLIADRDRLPADSDLIPALNVEISASRRPREVIRARGLP